MRDARHFTGILLMLAVTVGPVMAAAKPHSRTPSRPSRPAAHRSASPAPLTTAQLARLVLPSVVSLTVLDASGQPSVQGSGFVVGPNLIATNVHVIRGAHAVNANFVDGRSEKVYGYVDVDNARDLVLLYANTNGVRALPLMTDNSVQVGDPVIAVGSPEGYGGSMSTGIISQIRRDGDTKYLQTTAPISHGSSGGALVDVYGRVLGVTSFFNKDGQNLNFAYAAYYVQQLLPHGRPAYTSWADLENYMAEQTNTSPVAPSPPAPSVPVETAPAPVETVPAPPALSDASDSAKYNDKPLIGLKGVAVVVEDISEEAKNDGLDAKQIRTDVELKLRTAGIKVFESVVSQGNDSLAGIDITISIAKSNTTYTYCVVLDVLERVQLQRATPIYATAAVYTTSKLGTVDTKEMAVSCRNAVKDEVDGFANDYLAQNPTQTSVSPPVPNPSSLPSSPPSLLTPERLTALNSSLLEAADKGDLPSITQCLDAGADINVRDAEFDMTPLMIAVRGSFSEAINLLIKRGADINASCAKASESAFPNHRMTALSLAETIMQTWQLLIDVPVDTSKWSKKQLQDKKQAEKEAKEVVAKWKPIISTLKQYGAKE